MSKYSALGDYLKRQHRDLVPMTFAEIEKITGVQAAGLGAISRRGGATTRSTA